MKTRILPIAALVALGLVVGTVLALPRPTAAQLPLPYGPPVEVSTTPTSQRNALNNVRSQVNWVQNATRTAPNYVTGGVELVWQQFQSLRASYNDLKMTLTPRQLAEGANELAELDAGLDILQEAFGNYQEDVAAGRPPSTALREMCQVLREGTALWTQQLNRSSSRIRIGW